jgi:hypothetical protein
MRAEALLELCAVMRGVPGGTLGTHGTTRVATAQPPGTDGRVPAQKGPLFQVFQVFQVEHDMGQEARSGLGTLADADALAEREAIAIEDGRVPPAYADTWVRFQTRKPSRPRH